MSISTVSYTNIIKIEPVVKVLSPASRDGNVSLFELLILCKFVKSLNLKKIFEIGTFDGRTTLNFATNVSGAGKVWTLDLFNKSKLKTKLAINYKDKSGWSDLNYINKVHPGKLFKDTKESKKIIQLFGDSADFDFSPYYNKMDLVFIDGSHSYDYIKNDTEVAMKLINNHGYIIWHDYEVWNDVTAYLNEFSKLNMNKKKLLRLKDTSLVLYKR